jgi:citrate synthase
MNDAPLRTAIATHSHDRITIRGASLVDDLIGELTFTEMAFFQIRGRRPTPPETRIWDMVLVTLMEHGFTPSVIATRMVAMSSPEATQAAVAAGLLAVGSQFVGTTEEAALLIETLLADPAGVDTAAQAIAHQYRAERRPLPGFGHHLHRPDDPRTPKLFAVARSVGVPGRHIGALEALSAAVDEVYGRHITINATGGIAAVLGEIGTPASLMRGLSLISRAAGLVGHVEEERRTPVGRGLWDLVEHGVTYTPPEAG